MKTEEILKNRAKQLAKPKEHEVAEADNFEVLVFRLAHERYAIETKYVREVYPLKDYTPIPCAPQFVFGMINVRRKILTVIDLKVLFSLPEGSHDDGKIIILQYIEKEFGILSNGFEGIMQIPINKLQTSLPTLTGIKQEFLKGVTPDGIVLLDGKKLLLCKQIVVDETVAI